MRMRVLAIEFCPELPPPISELGTHEKYLPWGYQLAIEHVTRRPINLCRNELNQPPKTGRRGENNYIIHLYGWKAWWLNATKVRHEKSSVTGTKETTRSSVEKSEVEKAKFIAKFYPIMTETRPTKNEYGEEKLKEIDITKLSSRCTPKRGRELDDFSDIESPSKRNNSKSIKSLAARKTTILRLGCDNEVILPDETETLNLEENT